MIPATLKNCIIKTPIVSTVHDKLRKMYLGHLTNVRRRRLHHFGIEIIEKVDGILEPTGARYFCDYGTMLGVVRDKKFIKHDDDVDYSIVAGSLAPKVLLELFDNKCEFSFSHAFEFRGKIAQITFVYKKIEVDFFYIYENGDVGIAPGFLPTDSCPYHSIGGRWRAVYLERPLIGNIIEYDFLGSHARIPENYDDLLTNCYGEWRTPVERWSHTGKTGQQTRVKCEDLAEIVGRERVVAIG